MGATTKSAVSRSISRWAKAETDTAVLRLQVFGLRHAARVYAHPDWFVFMVLSAYSWLESQILEYRMQESVLQNVRRLCGWLRRVDTDESKEILQQVQSSSGVPNGLLRLRILDMHARMELMDQIDELKAAAEPSKPTK